MKTKDQKTIKSKGHSIEAAKKEKTAQKRSDAVDELQKEKLPDSNEGSYSEHLDVTPPVPHGFPTFGTAETNFLPGNHGRTTGRMIDDEPGV